MRFRQFGRPRIATRARLGRRGLRPRDRHRIRRGPSINGYIGSTTLRIKRSTQMLNLDLAKDSELHQAEPRAGLQGLRVCCVQAAWSHERLHGRSSSRRWRGSRRRNDPAKIIEALSVPAATSCSWSSGPTWPSARSKATCCRRKRAGGTSRSTRHQGKLAKRRTTTRGQIWLPDGSGKYGEYTTRHIGECGGRRGLIRKMRIRAGGVADS